MNKLEERMLRAEQLLGESAFNKVKDNPEELRKAVHQKMVEGMFPPMSAEEASFYFHRPNSYVNLRDVKFSVTAKKFEIN